MLVLLKATEPLQVIDHLEFLKTEPLLVQPKALEDRGATILSQRPRLPVALFIHHLASEDRMAFRGTREDGLEMFAQLGVFGNPFSSTWAPRGK